MECMVKRQMGKIPPGTDETTKSVFLKEIFQIIGNSTEEDTAPVLLSKIIPVNEKYFGEADSYEAEKKQYNAMMLDVEPEIEARLRQAADPVYTAALYARVGNYIDFGAMDHVSGEKLQELIQKAEGETLDPKEYAAFLQDMEQARELVYLTDNCGEIVLDKLLIRELLRAFPHVKITVLVRGSYVINDATWEDAETAGLTDLVPVVGNGTAIAGTSLKDLSPEARKLLDSADLIISKGQGNFETLNGCGLNIYYMFLCKCHWFVKRFGMKQYEGVFVNDRNLDF